MRKPYGQLKIGTLMIAIAAVAALLALPAMAGMIVIALSIVCISSLTAQWLVYRRNRQLAACSFWAVAVWTNLVVAVACVPPDSYLLGAIFLGLLFVAIPAIAVAGNGVGSIVGRRRVRYHRALGRRVESWFSSWW